jgi:hypothetical protein
MKAGMKPKRRLQIRLGKISASRNERVQLEIERFRHAINTYPRRVAQDPGVSFQKHLGSIVETTGMRGRENRRRP